MAHSSLRTPALHTLHTFAILLSYRLSHHFTTISPPYLHYSSSLISLFHYLYSSSIYLHLLPVPGIFLLSHHLLPYSHYTGTEAPQGTEAMVHVLKDWIPEMNSGNSSSRDCHSVGARTRRSARKRTRGPSSERRNNTARPRTKY